MQNFSIEVSPRKVVAGSEAKRPATSAPCDNVPSPPAVPMSKAHRDPAGRQPRDISPLSDD